MREELARSVKMQLTDNIIIIVVPVQDVRKVRAIGLANGPPYAKQSIMLTSLAGGATTGAANSRAELSLNHAGLLPDALARIRGASRLKPEQAHAAQ